MLKYENETYLDSNEASKYLGKTVTAFRQFIARNTLVRRKLGGRLYFAIDDLNGFFARKAGDDHFESSGLSYDEALTVEQIQKDIILTTKANIYYFLKRHSVARYRDNANRTLFNRAEINSILGGYATTSVDDL